MASVIPLAPARGARPPPAHLQHAAGDLLFSTPVGRRLRCGTISSQRTNAESAISCSSTPPPPHSPKPGEDDGALQVTRRQVLSFPTACAGALVAASGASLVWSCESAALAAENGTGQSTFTDMPALRGKDYGKTRTKYPDYVETPSGLQYKDLREGAGPTPKPGDIVVIDWDGFTIGYYGRIFEARNKAKGGSFEGSEKDFFRFRVGADEVIPAFEEAILGMQVGSIKRIIVPPELGYPNYDYGQKGPRPITFSGQRALDFVLKNQGLIDKTLLFDIELLRIIPA